MLNPQADDYCLFDPVEKAKLIVVVDTEEEFDWFGNRSRDNTSVKALRYIERVQKIFEVYRVTPVYVIDYPVASQPDGYRPLQEIYQSGRCVIGAHLHPWVNPPFEEPLSRRNSFPGNLPQTIEAAKLKMLGDCIETNFGVRPVIYKAGRYGVGLHTAAILEEQGYEVDLSICPNMDYSAEEGPDFSGYSAYPYWFGAQRRLLELPLTVGFAGLLRQCGSTLHRTVVRPPWRTLGAVGLLSRLQLVDKIWLSPEGYLFSEHRKLVRDLYRDGLRIFSFAFHSPSVAIGNTPYVCSQGDLQQFLDRCRVFLDFFLGEFEGESVTPLELKQQLLHPPTSMLAEEAS
jgi:hypothetical protein